MSRILVKGARPLRPCGTRLRFRGQREQWQESRSVAALPLSYGRDFLPYTTEIDLCAVIGNRVNWLGRPFYLMHPLDAPKIRTLPWAQQSMEVPQIQPVERKEDACPIKTSHRPHGSVTGTGHPGLNPEWRILSTRPASSHKPNKSAVSDMRIITPRPCKLITIACGG